MDPAEGLTDQLHKKIEEQTQTIKRLLALLVKKEQELNIIRLQTVTHKKEDEVS